MKAAKLANIKMTLIVTTVGGTVSRVKMTNFEYIKEKIDEKTLAMAIAIMVDPNDAWKIVDEYLDWLRAEEVFSDGICQRMAEKNCKH